MPKGQTALVKKQVCSLTEFRLDQQHDDELVFIEEMGTYVCAICRNSIMPRCTICGNQDQKAISIATPTSPLRCTDGCPQQHAA